MQNQAPPMTLSRIPHPVLPALILSQTPNQVRMTVQGLLGRETGRENYLDEDTTPHPAQGPNLYYLVARQTRLCKSF
jgi:hypothetical protein